MTLYEKTVTGKGRVRYEPVSETTEWESLPEGAYLMVVQPAGRTVRQLLDTEVGRAQLLAASETMREAMVAAMVAAAKQHPTVRPTTKRERLAWRAYNIIMEDEGMVSLSVPRAADIVDAGIRVLTEAVG